MKVFRAGIAHLEPLADLYDQYRQFYEQPPDREGCRAFLAERLRRKESVVFAAQSESGQVVGFTQLYRSWCSVEMRELIYLYDLFVVPEARRSGVARALMEAARNYAAERGAGALKLETAITNEAAQALYEALGWERDREFYTYHLALAGQGGETP
jgi:ribosomal protein S18 acetylase RimI-like enzyme